MHKKSFQRLIVVAVIAILMNGCATLSKDECLTADWYAIGYEDGAKGHVATRHAEHRKSCAEYKVTPDIQRYLDGRERGLLQFCTSNKGYLYGVNGYHYKGVCPQHLEADFMHGYLYGKYIFDLEHILNDHNKRLKIYHVQMRDLRAEIKDNEKLLVSDHLKKKERIKLLDDIKHLRKDRRHLKRKIHDLNLRVGDVAGEIEYKKRNFVP